MKAELFQELLESVREAGAILRGEKEPSRAFSFEELDIKAIRRRYEMSQVKFASLLGVSKRTLEGWEQGRRKPHGPRAQVAPNRRQTPGSGAGYSP